MSEVNNISVELAATLHFNAGSSMPIGSAPRAKYEDKYISFIAGAKWQKERTKEIARNLLGLQAWIDDPSMKLLLTNITNELMKEI